MILALLLTTARILFMGAEDYKQQAIDWLTAEYQVDISVQDISAGIDFSGMVLTLNNVELLDSAALPFVLKFEYLFLHLDFWNSLAKQKFTFNRISLQGADLTLNSDVNKHNDDQKYISEKSQLTINKLKNIFLTQLNKVSVKESTLNYTDKFGIDKVIIIEQLNWLNKGNKHQGIGQASFPNALGENSLKFVIDVLPETSKSTFSGSLYLQAAHLNITDYLGRQVNDNANIIEATVGFDAWATFSNNRLDSVQVEFTHNQFSWSQLKQNYSWSLNGGALQLTNSDKGWLLDSYDLQVRENQDVKDNVQITAKGDQSQALINIKGLTIKDVLPVYLLHSTLTDTQINTLRRFDLDANITQVGLSLNSQKEWQFSLKMNQFKNRPVDAVPGISNASIVLQGGLQKGRVDIELGKQKIYFDGQFSRSMHLQSAKLDLQWLQVKNGLKLFSEQALLSTNELETHTEFSLLLPSKDAQNKSSFLSLYSYASLNDASKAKYYFPIKAMGKNLYHYLEPTLKKGHVDGAKILWYGAFNHYPYSEYNGIFQAWVPLRDAQYDFYDKWKGLKKVDLDLLFENDHLVMKAKKAHLGNINIAQLTATIDQLAPNGILTVKAEINDDAHKISAYLKASPLKDSVGSALSVLELSGPLAGNLVITIPFDSEHQETKTEGKVSFKNNSLDVKLSDDLVIPLKQVNGSFDFVNGHLTSNNITGLLLQQPIEIAFTAQEKKENYQVDVALNGIWKLDALKGDSTALSSLPVSGNLDWSGLVNFTHHDKGGYQYNVALQSATQGVRVLLPAPFHKNRLDSWPMSINVSGSDGSNHVKASIKDKLALDGKLNYRQGKYVSPYFSLNIGQSNRVHIDKSKQVININLPALNVANWYDYFQIESNKKTQNGALHYLENDNSLLALNEVNVDVKQVNLFNQPLVSLRSHAVNHDGKWDVSITSDNLQAQLEYRSGIPVRIDVNAKKVNLQALDFSLLKRKPLNSINAPQTLSENLVNDYPEIFLDCEICIYKNFNLSPLSMHIYPTKKRFNIDYIKIGGESEFTHVSGFWDQRITHIIFDGQGNRNINLLKRLDYSSPVDYQNAQLSGAVNWAGAPWQANLNTLNGDFSTELTHGTITEVSDKGTRLLSLFSLDSIYRSLNLEFENVFSKGFNFDKLTFSGNIKDGVMRNDDFYLSGSAGKIIGNGLIDLPNQETNYHFSYSPAVTSSLPVLAAFAINPLTGAAVLMLTKLLEPVVDTIIRVDFSVKGDLSNPEVKLVNRQRAQITLENSEVLQQMTEQKRGHRND